MTIAGRCSYQWILLDASWSSFNEKSAKTVALELFQLFHWGAHFLGCLLACFSESSHNTFWQLTQIDRSRLKKSGLVRKERLLAWVRLSTEKKRCFSTCPKQTLTMEISLELSQLCIRDIRGFFLDHTQLSRGQRAKLGRLWLRKFTTGGAMITGPISLLCDWYLRRMRKCFRLC